MSGIKDVKTSPVPNSGLPERFPTHLLWKNSGRSGRIARARASYNPLVAFELQHTRLRETPKAFATTDSSKDVSGTRLIAVSNGQNAKDATMGNPQGLSYVKPFGVFFALFDISFQIKIKGPRFKTENFLPLDTIKTPAIILCYISYFH
jgi:hypothetical protein